MRTLIKKTRILEAYFIQWLAWNVLIVLFYINFLYYQEGLLFRPPIIEAFLPLIIINIISGIGFYLYSMYKSQIFNGILFLALTQIWFLAYLFAVLFALILPFASKGTTDWITKMLQDLHVL